MITEVLNKMMDMCEDMLSEHNPYRDGRWELDIDHIETVEEIKKLVFDLYKEIRKKESDRRKD